MPTVKNGIRPLSRGVQGVAVLLPEVLHCLTGGERDDLRIVTTGLGQLPVGHGAGLQAFAAHVQARPALLLRPDEAVHGLGESRVHDEIGRMTSEIPICSSRCWLPVHQVRHSARPLRCRAEIPDRVTRDFHVVVREPDVVPSARNPSVLVMSPVRPTSTGTIRRGRSRTWTSSKGRRCGPRPGTCGVRGRAGTS